MRPELLGIQNLADMNRFFHIFIAVNRSDSAFRRSIRFIREPLFFEPIERDMIREDQDSAIADREIRRRDLDARRCQPVDFTAEVLRVDDGPAP